MKVDRVEFTEEERAAIVPALRRIADMIEKDGVVTYNDPCMTETLKASEMMNVALLRAVQNAMDGEAGQDSGVLA